MKIYNEITLEVVKNDKIFKLAFPGNVTYPECFEVLQEMHNNLLDDAKKKEEALKKAQEELGKKKEEVEPEVVEEK